VFPRAATIRLFAIGAFVFLTWLLVACGNPETKVLDCYPTNLGRPAAARDVRKVEVTLESGSEFHCPAGFTDGPQIDANGNCTRFGIQAQTCGPPVAVAPRQSKPPPPVSLPTITNPNVQTGTQTTP
jgi:hypothetical protein